MGEELTRERGDFNGQAVFGFFKPTLEASLPAASWYGMRVDLYSMNAVLTDEDGHLWYILRFHDHANSPAFRLRTNGYGGNLYSEFPGVERGYNRACEAPGGGRCPHHRKRHAHSGPRALLLQPVGGPDGMERGRPVLAERRQVSLRPWALSRLTHRAAGASPPIPSVSKAP